VTCGPQQDNVTARNVQITVSNTNLQPPTCEVLATSGVQIVASGGGTADAQFGSAGQNLGQCTFQQLASATPASPKTAYFTTRSPADALFQVTNGEASCTLNGVVMVPLCGQATLYPDGTSINGLIVACNSDPFVSIAVYRGGATLSLDKLPGGIKVHVGENDLVTADLATGAITHSVPQFTKEQISLFDVQLDAVAGGVSLTNRTSLLQVKRLSASNVVVAPNLIRYGKLDLMCQQASSVPVLFYPADPNASTPRVFGGVCNYRTATVYGVAIYRQTGFGFNGPFLKESGGGTLIRSVVFKSPIALEPNSPRPLFAWDGSVGESPFSSPSPTPAFAKRDVYVMKFVYDLPPDTTPRIGFVAVSLFGAPYPIQIG
jgi:hypothetical protein